MSRLIELDDHIAWPANIVVKRGDALLLKAGGAKVETGDEAITVIGPFSSSFAQRNGEVLSPMGAPDTVILLAKETGLVMVELFTGDFYAQPLRKILNIVVNE